MKAKNKYLKIFFSAHRWMQMLLKVGNLYKKLVCFLTQQYQKPNRHVREIKVLFLATLLTCIVFGQVVSAQTPNATALVEQGIEAYNTGSFFNAIKYWQEALNQDKNNPDSTAIINENLARAYQEIGDNKEAIASLSAAIRDYGAVENIQQVGRMKSELAQVYSSLGQPRKAIALLCGKLVDKSKSYENQPSHEIECTPESATQIATKYNDKIGQVAALGILGEAYRLIGDYNQAILYLRIAQKLDPGSEFLLLNSLGNAYKSRAQLRELQADSANKAGISSKESKFIQQSIEDYKLAYQYFDKSTKLASDHKDNLAEMRGLLNLIQLDSQTNKSKVINDSEFNKTLEDALKVLESLPDSATKVYGAIDLAYLQRDAKGTSPFTYCPTQVVLSGNNEVLNLLNNSVLTSKKLQDNRLISYSNGALGHLWECRADNEKALKYTQAAILAAENKLSAKDSLYLWEWQAGRILDKQNRKEEAIASYQRAFDTLEDIRSDILTAERNVQFDLRDVVRPLYRTLAQSRLDLLDVGAIADERRAKELSKVVNTIDALKLAELQNYFGNDCILSALNPKQVGELLQDNSVAFQNTGFLSSIILDGKTGILLQLPNQATKFKWIEDPNQKGIKKIVSSDTLQEKITEFRTGLVKGKEEFNYNTTTAAQLYDWIIRPFAEDLKPEKIKTLVFIQDGFLRSVPMAALYDSQQQKYLVETYAIATTPSLRLNTPKASDRRTQKALILGLTEKATIDGKTFDALSAVSDEVNAIKSIFPNHTDLIDEKFFPESFQKTLDKSRYPIVHIASHAQFGIIPEDTFIVTGKNQKLTISELENSLRNLSSKSDPVELLTLTACETAVGDDRATLGLAGVALQVGVKSAIASLWNVTDESTSELVKEFYTNYHNSGMSIAEALQKAQIKMIHPKKSLPSEDIDTNYENPAYWAPMIAIGNWL
ncbi:MAG: CHAT domain-containing protein [Nostoc sp. DedVER02]|uniref:CHAT domain-containing protein n=1 Tax=unclassified Nostoc TaxID=2593658 RepID=UPI002AD2035B|nr:MULTISPECIES: CHAT domain-containing protein [unclassified Nostoc]MDZ7985028.1 CHAT domain-containing protein [Nostoc sp. DedVER02]MDZ8114084.1 CHAT domain-containing protein [Nostoc sp. DedVER01b]